MVSRPWLLSLVLPLVACTAWEPTSKPMPEALDAGVAAWSGPAVPAARGGPGEAPLPPDGLPAQWLHVRFPGKAATEFSYAHHAGRHSMAVRSESSASMLRQSVRVEPADLGRITFAWKVPELIATADMALRDKDDSPVRVVLAFEGDRNRLSAKDLMLSELARALTGEDMPYATLMYVWCNHRKPGSVIPNPRTDRIRALVVESGPHRLNQWLDYERDIRADYLATFGELPGALVGVAIMSDSDNTRSVSSAWYGAVRVWPAGSVATVAQP